MAKQTILSGPDVTWTAEKTKINENFTELYPTSDYAWYHHNASKRGDYILSRLANTSKAYKMLTENEFDLFQAGDTYGHDATLVHHYDLTKLYCVYCANQVTTGDSATYVNAFVRLQKISCTLLGVVGPIDSTITVAKNGDVVGGKTITSGAGVPNAFLIGNILHILWSAQCSDNIWYEMHCAYDCSTDTLGTPEICTMDSGLMTCQTIATHLGLTVNGMISMNASIASFNSQYYACACSGTSFPAGAILRTTDFVNWEFVFTPSFGDLTSEANYEGALGALSGYLYLALRQSDTDATQDLNPLFLIKIDTSHNVVDVVTVPSCQSRPSFFMRGTTELYLAYPVDNRLSTTLLKIGTYDLKDSVPLQDIPTGGNYVQVAPRTSNMQFVVRTQGSTGIRVSSMNGLQLTNLNIMTSFNTAMGY